MRRAVLLLACVVACARPRPREVRPATPATTAPPASRWGTEVPSAVVQPAASHIEMSPAGKWARVDEVVVDTRAYTTLRLAEPGVALHLELSPDDVHAVVSAGTDRPHLVALAARKVVFRFGAPIRTHGWSPNGRWMAFTDAREAVMLLDTATGTTRELDAGRPPVTTVALDDEFAIVDLDASRSGPHEVRVFAIATGAVVATSKEPRPSSWVLDRARRRIVIADYASRPALRAFDLQGKATRLPVTIPSYQGMCGREGHWELVSADGDRIRLQRDCSGRDYADVDVARRTVSTSTVADGGDLEADANEVQAILGSGSGVLASGSWARVGGRRVLLHPRSDGVHLIEAKPRGAELGLLEDSRGFERESIGEMLQASRDGTRAIGLDRYGRARLWDLESRKLLWSTPPRPEIIALAIRAPDASGGPEDLVTVSDRGTLRRWAMAAEAASPLRRTTELPGALVDAGCKPDAIVLRDDGRVVFTCITRDDEVHVILEGAPAPALSTKRTGYPLLLDARGTSILEVTYDRGAPQTSVRAIGGPPRGGEETARAVVPPYTMVQALSGGTVLGTKNVPPPSTFVTWSWRTGQDARALGSAKDGHPGLDPTGRWVVIERKSGVELYAVNGAATRTLPPLPEGYVGGRAVSPGGRRMAVWAIDHLWTNENDNVLSYRPPRRPFLAWSSDERTIATEIESAGAAVVDLTASPPRIHRVYAAPFSSDGVIVHPDGHVVLSGDPAAASSLLACRVGARTFAFAECASALRR